MKTGIKSGSRRSRQLVRRWHVVKEAVMGASVAGATTSGNVGPYAVPLGGEGPGHLLRRGMMSFTPFKKRKLRKFR